MFSGIVEAQSRILKIEKTDSILRLSVSKPSYFNDIKIGDSICTNGICLTVEKFDSETIHFCLGIETLNILGSSIALWSHYPLNLERSLKFGDRVHGHLVTGHVDQLGTIIETYADGDCWQIQIRLDSSLMNYFWKKGSICLNGVSLTVNNVVENVVSVCLIPETIKATNLKFFLKGQHLTVESDYLAKAYFNLKQVNL